MSAGTQGPSQPVVLRQTSALLVPVAVWVFCAGAVADAVIEGTTGYAVRVLVLMAAIAFAAWMLLASPCLVIEVEGLRVVNPVRVHWVPFGALDAVRVRGLTAVTVRTESGRLRTITSWNAPGQPRQLAGVAAPVAETIERSLAAWEARAGDSAGAVLVTTWRWQSALALLALVGANIAIWFR
jgi:hypothetical protein